MIKWTKKILLKLGKFVLIFCFVFFIYLCIDRISLEYRIYHYGKILERNIEEIDRTNGHKITIRGVIYYYESDTIKKDTLK